ncbi:MAG: type II toxin-antitoxin system ParD family antitoxin [Deltaproteobacteria bacterium]|nr:type II toxin-antitoxin system ParD family antitoxin [Deltaproteobacteria bacterium]
MNVSLTAQLEQFVSKKVASGRYTSASEVIREALRLLEERDKVRDLHLQELGHEVQVGIEQLDKGLSPDLDMADIKAQARRKLSKAKRK